MNHKLYFTALAITATLFLIGLIADYTKEIDCSLMDEVDFSIHCK